ncbi:hypothetical protein BKI52_26385 [marine bacterium AO1-C]|nr:hypothetical protein BKI52_26385 [marine bacterium AO1-C]
MYNLQPKAKNKLLNKMIGALGILVAIGGFVFLWVMLNYHTMNKIRLQAEELKAAIAETPENDAQTLKTYQQRYQIKKHRYNQMVNEMPSKLVANVLNLKPLQ